MKTILVIDACVRREESRSRRLLDRALEVLKKKRPDWKFEIRNLMEEQPRYWTTESLKERDRLLACGQYDAPVFAYGNQFREADAVIVAAPFWDLSVPAVLKVYIENISAEGITFSCGPQGLMGICRGRWLLFLTTRGGIYGDGELEQGSRYMCALSKFFGIDAYHCVVAEGLDDASLDGAQIMEDALEQVAKVCRMLAEED